ncbi:hypothetical protein J7J47_16330 [Halomonas sp. ISL-60]|uniref:hypothetical protein n=1 Tax=Halomonas sp. ISL-56 TaxID=2819149 RepID=UPI001BEC9790|nr:hypothetical protein [Halomonas sp. ISL-56]MBT2773791.1 hypothetical protein [Halomonas sp. ISL-60]MBT2800025.1 hypothetical protein [Halomonas sp. ISL-56]
MPTVFEEREAEQQLRDECRIPDDWSGKAITIDMFFLSDHSRLARDITQAYGIDDSFEVSRMIREACTRLCVPEGLRMFEFVPPAGHEMEGYSFLLTATKRDMEMGIPKYLGRLDTDQLYNAQSIIAELIKKKTDEPKRVVWRVCDDFMCLGNFREEDYLKAVEFMAEKAKQKYADEPNDKLRHKQLQIEIKPERVPESEYESFFE